jgi:predicted nucleic acid-binding protein
LIFVDSSVWVDYFNGTQSVETDCLDSLLGKEPVGLGDVVLIEVLQGFRRDQDYKIAKDLLTALTVFTLGGQEMAIESADNFRLLRKKGITVRKTIDVLIATFCINKNLPLLHSEKDFDPFHQYLRLENALEFVKSAGS